MRKTSTNKTYLLKVTDSDSNFDENAEFALIEITPALKAHIEKIFKNLLKLKAEVDPSIYDIRVFNNSPEFLAYGEAYQRLGDNVLSAADEGMVILTAPSAKEMVGAETVRTDIVLLQIKEEGFFWTGYYKHTEIRFTTERMNFSDL